MSTPEVDSFREIWLADFEFHQPDGERPTPLCMVAREYRTGRIVRLGADELVTMSAAPFPTGADNLVVAYYSSAEWQCFLALGWSLPQRVLDLYVEHRNATNGLTVPCGNGLLGAMACRGIDAMEAREKESVRQLAMRGGPYNDEEQKALLDYCESDVRAMAKLLDSMAPTIDWPRALLRGRSMVAMARMEWTGVPLDIATLDRVNRHRSGILDRLVDEVDRSYGVYDGHTFRVDRFERWLDQRQIPWPRFESGRLELSSDVFRQAARKYPEIALLHELRSTLSQMRAAELAVGSDGRNRCLLSPFGARTSRCTPSTTKYIFGPSCWMRGLIQPTSGRALAYVDWEQQEFGVAAALSHDECMMAAYRSGDPYLGFATQAGAVPAGATKDTHAQARAQYKEAAIAMMYGRGGRSLAQGLGVSETRARGLLQTHRDLYPAFHRWSDAVVSHAMAWNSLRTVFGWMIHVGRDTSTPSLLNFPVQANAAEVLRLACCLATERGVSVCCPVHDALLVEDTVDRIDATVEATQQAMAEASRVVLGGFELRSEAKVVCWPGRYMDPRGEQMWAIIMSVLAEIESGTAAPSTR